MIVYYSVYFNERMPVNVQRTLCQNLLHIVSQHCNILHQKAGVSLSWQFTGLCSTGPKKPKSSI